MVFAAVQIVMQVYGSLLHCTKCLKDSSTGETTTTTTLIQPPQPEAPDPESVPYRIIGTPPPRYQPPTTTCTGLVRIYIYILL